MSACGSRTITKQTTTATAENTQTAAGIKSCLSRSSPSLSRKKGRKICVVRCTRVRTPRPHCSFHVAMRFLPRQGLASVIHSSTTKLATFKYRVRVEERYEKFYSHVCSDPRPPLALPSSQRNSDVAALSLSFSLTAAGNGGVAAAAAPADTQTNGPKFNDPSSSLRC